MSTSPIPKVRDDDPEDVSWALSTAATSFARGDRTEALKWLRRAAEAASEADRDARALEIAKAAADLTPPSIPPKPAPKQPPPKPAAKTPSPAPVSKRPPQKSKADDTSKRPAMKSRPRSLPPSDERTVTYVTTEVTKLDARPPHEDADAWPTESMGAEELDALGQVYGQERTRIGTPAYQGEKKKGSSKPPPPEVPVRFSQAVHVVVWRDADGTLRIAPRGTEVSAVTIDALLVAPAPDVDLIAWLSR